MCGISGIIGEPAANQYLYEALNLLQHRGQDAAGIATSDARFYYHRRARGLVRDVFQIKHLQRLQGQMGVGHVRYPTTGSAYHPGLIQPFYVNSPYGLMLVHNGDLTNSKELLQVLVEQDKRHLNTDSDSEVLLNILARELHQRGGQRPTPEQIFAAVRKVHQHCRGAYAVVVMLIGHGLLAFRDPYGIRPLSYGSRSSVSGNVKDYLFASESVAIRSLGFDLEGDVAPGEAIFVNTRGEMFSDRLSTARLRPCIFEYVYLARPDSVLDGVSVYDSRRKQGEYLAAKIRKAGIDDIEVVIPVPDTGRVVAQAIAAEFNIPVSEGLMKNRYVGRTFIMAEQHQRSVSVWRKLNPIASEFAGRNVLLVDDSIVRGTTSRQIVDMARSSGAAKVYFASAAPPVRYQNIYGIDMPVRDELVATRHDDHQQIAEEIGADWLIFQDLDDLENSVRTLGAGRFSEFENSVFTGDYITESNNQQYLDNYLHQVSRERRDHSEELSGSRYLESLRTSGTTDD